MNSDFPLLANIKELACISIIFSVKIGSGWLCFNVYKRTRNIREEIVERVKNQGPQQDPDAE